MKRIEELGISPWPWVYDFDILHNIMSGRFSIANVYGDFLEDKPPLTVANSHLIASAPELYETEYNLVCAVERLLNGRAGTCDVPTQTKVVAAIEAAKKAIAKAAGEE